MRPLARWLVGSVPLTKRTKTFGSSSAPWAGSGGMDGLIGMCSLCGLRLERLRRLMQAGGFGVRRGLGYWTRHAGALPCFGAEPADADGSTAAVRGPDRRGARLGAADVRGHAGRRLNSCTVGTTRRSNLLYLHPLRHDTHERQSRRGLSAAGVWLRTRRQKRRWHDSASKNEGHGQGGTQTS